MGVVDELGAFGDGGEKCAGGLRGLEWRRHR